MWNYGLCGPPMTFRTNLGVKEIDLVEFVHLLQEDEGENCVWPETSVIRSKTLPQTEESFLPYNRYQHIQTIFVLWLPINHSHVLDSGLNNVYWHGGSSGD